MAVSERTVALSSLATAVEGQNSLLQDVTTSLDRTTMALDHEQKERARLRVLATIALVVLVLFAALNVYSNFWLAPARAAVIRKQLVTQAEVVKRVDEATSDAAKERQAAQLAALIAQLDSNQRKALQDALNAIYAAQGKPAPTIPSSPTSIASVPRPSGSPTTTGGPAGTDKKTTQTTTTTTRPPTTTTTKPASPPTTRCVLARTPLGDVPCVLR